MQERAGILQYHGGRDLDALAVRGPGLALVLDLHADLVDVEADVRPVLDAEINEEVLTGAVDIVQPDVHVMLPGTDVPVFGRGVPDPPGEPGHLLRGHGYRRVVVRQHLRLEDGLLRHGFVHPGRVDEPILDAIALGDDGDDGEDVAVCIDVGALLRLEAERVRERLVTGHLTRRDVHETDGLRRRDNRRDLVVDGEQLKPRGRLLSPEQ